MRLMTRGYLALILHAHLPFVRHPEHDRFLEEDWLYEAITETYIPLLRVLDGWDRDRVDYRLTMSLSPSLCSMLRDQLLQDRYERHINRLVELAAKEVERTKWDQPLHELAWSYHQQFQETRRYFVEVCHRDLVAAFGRFQETGRLEIITCAATHAFLPMMQDQPGAIRAQILTARDHYRECFGRNPRGIWLPECAYVPGLDAYLREAEIRWFTVDTHGLLFAQPRPVYNIYAPVYTPAGVAAFGRDLESSRQVWSSEEGYPGDFDYRDFYRDIGYDLELDYIRPYIHPDGIRCFTGIKYHKITGPDAHKEIYVRRVALDRAAAHAAHFANCRAGQVDHLFNAMQRPPIVVAPYDAELFGHWWHEGPDFLNFLVRQVARDQLPYRLVTPTEYLRANPANQIATPAASSWGNRGYWEVWLEKSNAWIYPHLHMATERMIELARQHPQPDPLRERALNQAARELMLAQASDWAFIMKTGTSVDYAIKRTKDHLLRFNRLHDQLHSGEIDQDWLATLESRDNIFPHIAYRHYA
jgi:1,4-alpha-glucan branching enzyme